MVMFGGWLVGQAKRDDWVGCLASQAAKDPRFPRAADAEQIRKYLGTRGAGPDEYEMLDDAETEYLRETAQ